MRLCASARRFRVNPRRHQEPEELRCQPHSNTVLTRANSPGHPGALCPPAQRRGRELQLWNYFPMERSGHEDLVVSMKEFVASSHIAVLGEDAEKRWFKSFPSCLPGGSRDSSTLFPVTCCRTCSGREFSECGFGACFQPADRSLSRQECCGTVQCVP